MNFLFIVLGFIVVVLIYILYNYTLTMNSLVTTANLIGQNQPVILPGKPTASYTMSCWLYLKDNANFNQTPKNQYYIFSRKGLFNLFIQMNGGLISIYIQTNEPSNAKYLLLNDLPIQSWAYLTLSVYNKFIDFFINGKLITSVKTDINIPLDSAKTVGVGSGYVTSGYNSIVKGTKTATVIVGSEIATNVYNAILANLVYLPNATSPQAAYTAYTQANNASTANMLTTYTVDVALVKNDVVQTTQTIL